MRIRMAGWLAPCLVLAIAAVPGRTVAKPLGMAPPFTLPARTGTACLDSLRGKVVLVDFWASWCGPCHKSFPWMQAMQAKYAGRGLVIVAISVDKSRDAADDFLAKHPAPFTVAFDHSGRTAEAWRVSGMPSTYLVGPRGQLLYSHVGFESGKTAPLEALIEENCKP